MDVASSLATEIVAIPTPQPLHTNELFSESISNSPFSRGGQFGHADLDQHEMLDLFMQKVDEMDVINEDPTSAEATDHVVSNETEQAESSTSSSQRTRKRSIRHIEEPFSELPQGSNSLTNLMQTSWSADLDAHTPTKESGARFFQRSVSMSSTTSLRTPTADRCSYNALLRKHENNREDGSGWSQIWEKFRANPSTLNLSQTHTQREIESNATDDMSELQSVDVSYCSIAMYDIKASLNLFPDQLRIRAAQLEFRNGRTAANGCPTVSAATRAWTQRTGFSVQGLSASARHWRQQLPVRRAKLLIMVLA